MARYSNNDVLETDLDEESQEERKKLFVSCRREPVGKLHMIVNWTPRSTQRVDLIKRLQLAAKKSSLPAVNVSSTVDHSPSVL